MLIVSLVGSAVVLAIQALVPTVGLFLALRAVLGVWLAGVTATLAVLTRLSAPSGGEGAAFSAACSAKGLGPILGPAVVAVGSIPALYLLVALMMLLLVLVPVQGRPSVMVPVLDVAPVPGPPAQPR